MLLKFKRSLIVDHGKASGKGKKVGRNLTYLIISIMKFFLKKIKYNLNYLETYIFVNYFFIKDKKKNK